MPIQLLWLPRLWATNQKTLHYLGLINDRKMGRIVDGIMLRSIPKKKSKPSSSLTANNTGLIQKSPYVSLSSKAATNSSLRIETHLQVASFNTFPELGGEPMKVEVE